MSGKVIREKQDLTYLRWAHARNSSGTAGTLLKSGSNLSGEKIYYKLSSYDPERGVIGHECINEIIVDRLLTLLGVEHLDYDLIYADIEIEGRIFETFLCASQDFKKRGESKVALDDFYRGNALPGESHYDFCLRNGWMDRIDTMIAVDFIIQNRDRHGANIEVLRDSRAHTIRLAPLFDHGLSLLFPCQMEEEVRKFDVMEDRRCQNFIGSLSTRENLKYLAGKGDVFPQKITPDMKKDIFRDLEGLLSAEHMDKIWKMIYERYLVYEDLQDHG